jgi:hypothetical protein
VEAASKRFFATHQISCPYSAADVKLNSENVYRYPLKTNSIITNAL